MNIVKWNIDVHPSNHEGDFDAPIDATISVTLRFDNIDDASKQITKLHKDLATFLTTIKSLV